MPTDRRQAACLRAERVGVAAHHAGQVVERVLGDYNCRLRESQRFRPDHFGPSTQRRVGGKAAGKEYGLALSLTGEAAPRESCRRHATTKLWCEGPPEDKIWSLPRQAWCPPREV